MIVHLTLLGHTAALSDGEASYLLWIIGVLSVVVWVLGFRPSVRNHRWYALINGAAFLALPALLLIGMVVSMMPLA